MYVTEQDVISIKRMKVCLKAGNQQSLTGVSFKFKLSFRVWLNNVYVYELDLTWPLSWILTYMTWTMSLTILLNNWNKCKKRKRHCTWIRPLPTKIILIMCKCLLHWWAGWAFRVLPRSECYPVWHAAQSCREREQWPGPGPGARQRWVSRVRTLRPQTQTWPQSAASGRHGTITILRPHPPTRPRTRVMTSVTSPSSSLRCRFSLAEAAGTSRGTRPLTSATLRTQSPPDLQDRSVIAEAPWPQSPQTRPRLTPRHLTPEITFRMLSSRIPRLRQFLFRLGVSVQFLIRVLILTSYHFWGPKS